jgi:1,2-diacylglycerol 3-alpha-glucosyltransferase
MNIAIFTDSFYPQINGVDTSILSIAENFTQRGHGVVILAPRYKMSEDFQHPKIKIKRIPSLPASFYDDFRWTFTNSYPFYKYLRDEKVDIVHFMTPFFASYIGIKIARLLKVPLVGTFHTFIADPAYYEHLFNGPVTITPQVAWNYCNVYYNAADYVTAPTLKAVKEISDNGVIVPLEALSNGIDFKQFANNQTQEIKTRYNLGKNVVLFIGRIAYEKSIKVLIDSFKIALEQLPDSQLLLVGDGPQLEEFKDYAQQKDISKSIIFAGAIPHKELVQSGIFSLVKVFATASESETQGITILEAQVNKILTVGVKAGGVMDLIDDGVNGYLVDPKDSQAMGDRIAYCLKNFNALKDVREQAKISTGKHDIILVMDRWEEIYSELIAKNQRGELEEKDYLHFKTILGITRQFKIDLNFYFKRFSHYLKS